MNNEKRRRVWEGYPARERCMVWSGALEANAGGEYLRITNIEEYMDTRIYWDTRSCVNTK